MSGLFLLNDTPSLIDSLHFQKNYVEPLCEIITDPATKTPLTIGILGEWGSGKTTLLRLIESNIKVKHENYRHLWFNPWMYQNEDNLLIPLLHTMYDEFEPSLNENLKNSFRRVLQVVGRIGANVLLKTVTLGNVELENVDDEIDKYNAKMRQEIVSEVRKLRTTLQQVVRSLFESDNGNPRLLIYVDDLDRCVPQKIVSLLEAIKLFLDLEQTVVFLAIDKSVVQHGIQLYYEKFKFTDEKIDSLTSDYMDKMIQLPLYLYPLGENQIGNYLQGLKLPSDIDSYAEIFQNCLQPNPRRIKRVINTVLIFNTLMERSNRSDIDRNVLVKLIIFQQQWPSFYSEILSHPLLLESLELVYIGKLELNVEGPWDFIKDTEERKLIRQLCQEHYQTHGVFANLFKVGPQFRNLQLVDYLYLLG